MSDMCKLAYAVSSEQQTLNRYLEQKGNINCVLLWKYTVSNVYKEKIWMD